MKKLSLIFAFLFLASPFVTASFAKDNLSISPYIYEAREMATRAQGYIALKEWDKALEYIDIAINHYQKEPDFYSKKSLILINLNENKKALKAIDKAILLDKENTHYFGMRGEILSNLNRNREAIKEYEKILNNDNKDFLALLSIGLEYGKLKRFKKSNDYLFKALKIHPDSIDVYNSLALNYYRSKNYKESFKYFEKITIIDEKNAEAFYNSACVASLMSKKELALENLKKAIELEPSFKKQAKEDKDLKNIRKSEIFKKLVK